MLTFNSSRLLKRWWRQGFILLFSSVFALVAGLYYPSLAKSSPEILWDRNGVPHIYGKDQADTFYAFGWAQMHSHGDLLLRLYGQGRGRAAEYWGQEYRESDRWVRTMGIPERAVEWYAAQSPAFRRSLDAFAAGVNAYAQAHPDLIEDAVESVLPVTATDVLAHGQRVLNFTFVVDAKTIAALGADFQNGNQAALQPDRAHVPGSNAWAIAPSHTTNNHAMLLANPHLPWFDLYRWYEAHITAPGIDAYGATLVGIPVLAVAFNDNLGWSHTVNTHDGWDAYKLTLVEGGYRWDDQVQPFRVKTQTLRVKQSDGTLREESLVIRQSVHGPVVAEKNGQAIALRVVGLDRPGVLEQWWDMARAQKLSEFEAALQRLQLPMFTVMYADRDGHILHVFNGQVPVRSQGDFAQWSKVVPGDTSRTLWTDLHPYSDLPRVLDPPSGWLQNANDPPWTTTVPLALNPDDYPAYIAPRGPMSLRSQRSAQMLLQDDRVSFAELLKYKHSTRMALADRLLDDLIPAAKKRGSATARQAVEVLSRWDRHTNANSRGAVLFAQWVEAMNFSKLFAAPWNEASPLTTPDGLANPDEAVATLERVAAQLKTRYGRLDVPWGSVFRLSEGKTTVAANGANDPLGVFRSLWFDDADNHQFSAVGGDSYTAAIEFSRPVRAMALTSYGNATQPPLAAPLQSQALQLFSQQKLRPVWRSRREIEAHLATRDVLRSSLRKGE